jgi:hypothetical protein
MLIITRKILGQIIAIGFFMGDIYPLDYGGNEKYN